VNTTGLARNTNNLVTADGERFHHSVLLCVIISQRDITPGLAWRYISILREGQNSSGTTLTGRSKVSSRFAMSSVNRSSGSVDLYASIHEL